MDSNRRALLLIWLMMLVAYVDRVNITIAGPSMMKALHIGKLGFGVALSAFTAGYALMQIPGGWLADRLRPRWILVSALVIWSAFTALTGRVWSKWSLVATRVCFGLGEGIENGAQFKLIADRFDQRERSQANASFLTALALGPALALPFAAWLLRVAGWRDLFAWFALAGIVVAVLIALFLPDSAVKAATSAEDGAEASAGRRAVLTHPQTHLSFSTYLFFNVAFWGLIGWMPTYLAETRGITLARLGWISSIPYLAGFVGMQLFGRLGKRELFRVRALMVGAGYILAAIFLTCAFRAAHVAGCIAALCGAAFFLYGGFGPFWAIAMDGVPAAVRGAFSGFVNFGGQVGGFVAPIIVGAVVARTHSFADGFSLMAGSLVIAAACLFGLHASERRILGVEVANN